MTLLWAFTVRGVCFALQKNIARAFLIHIYGELFVAIYLQIWNTEYWSLFSILKDLLFEFHFKPLWSNKISKWPSQFWSRENTCRKIPFCPTKSHLRVALHLVLACALAPRPLNLDHCHLENIWLVTSGIAIHLSSLPACSWPRVCHQNVAVWKAGALFGSHFSALLFLVTDLHISSLHLSPVWTRWAVSSREKSMFPLDAEIHCFCILNFFRLFQV